MNEIKATSRTKTIFMKWQETEQYIAVCTSLKISLYMSFIIPQSYDRVHVVIEIYMLKFNSLAARLYMAALTMYY